MVGGDLMGRDWDFLLNSGSPFGVDFSFTSCRIFTFLTAIVELFDFVSFYSITDIFCMTPWIRWGGQIVEGY